VTSTSTALAVDLGGTNMRAAIVGEDGALTARQTRRTPRGDPRPDALVALIRDVCDGVETAPGYAVIGVPGRVDHASGRSEHAPNLPASWRPHLTEKTLASALDLKVHLANDADLAAVGEAYFGAGEGLDDVAYVTVSTGVGAGVVLRGRLVHGRRSLAEVGHSIVDLAAMRRGEPCTFETLGSGTAMARRAKEAGIPVSGAEFVALVRTGDAAALAVWERVVEALAVGVANVAWAFSPDVVVMGGGLGRTGDLLYDPIRALLAKRGPPGLAVKVVCAALGDDAGLVGGGAWLRATG
jgi:glucokinase